MISRLVYLCCVIVLALLPVRADEVAPMPADTVFYLNAPSLPEGLLSGVSGVSLLVQGAEPGESAAADSLAAAVALGATDAWVKKGEVDGAQMIQAAWDALVSHLSSRGAELRVPTIALRLQAAPGQGDGLKMWEDSFLACCRSPETKSMGLLNHEDIAVDELRGLRLRPARIVPYVYCLELPKELASAMMSEETLGSLAAGLGISTEALRSSLVSEDASACTRVRVESEERNFAVRAGEVLKSYALSHGGDGVQAHLVDKHMLLPLSKAYEGWSLCLLSHRAGESLVLVVSTQPEQAAKVLAALGEMSGDVGRIYASPEGLAILRVRGNAALGGVRQALGVVPAHLGARAGRLAGLAEAAGRLLSEPGEAKVPLDIAWWKDEAWHVRSLLPSGGMRFAESPCFLAKKAEAAESLLVLECSPLSLPELSGAQSADWRLLFGELGKLLPESACRFLTTCWSSVAPCRESLKGSVGLVLDLGEEVPPLLGAKRGNKLPFPRLALIGGVENARAVSDAALKHICRIFSLGPADLLELSSSEVFGGITLHKPFLMGSNDAFSPNVAASEDAVCISSSTALSSELLGFRATPGESFAGLSCTVSSAPLRDALARVQAAYPNTPMLPELIAFADLIRSASLRLSSPSPGVFELYLDLTL
ncbi:MAG: hypothetical protein ACI4OZ_09515 [Akkermansia sp.]